MIWTQHLLMSSLIIVIEVVNKVFFLKLGLK